MLDNFQFRTKKGKMNIKTFLEHWKQGINGVTAFQQVKMQISSTWIIIIFSLNDNISTIKFILFNDMMNITSMYQQATALQIEPYNFGVGLFAGFTLFLVMLMIKDIIKNKILKPKKKHDLTSLKTKFAELCKASEVIKCNSEELNKIMGELENA